MKVVRASKVLLIMVLLFSIFGCGTVIPPGEVGIKINRMGDNRGVSELTLSTGLVLFCPGWSSVFAFPTYMQTAQWTKSGDSGRKDRNDEIVFNTKDGMVVSGDVSLSYQLDAAKVPAFYVKFRTDDLDLFTHGYLFNVARDAFNEIGSLYSVDEIYGVKKEEYVSKVKERVNSQIASYGVIIQQFGFLGKLRLPDEVVGAINGKIQAQQDAMKVQNQVAAAKAEAEKIVKTAEGTARANELIAKSISASLIQWEQLQIQKSQIARWNGAYPYFMAGANTPFMFNVPTPATK